MVDAVNAWFGQAEARTDEGAINQGTDGAFRFRGRNDNPMPFFPVQAQGRPDRFRDGNGPIPALTIQHDLRLTSGARSRSAFAARCAERVVHWLNDPRVGFEDPDKGFQRLRPADIAVLVRDRHEAAAVRRALRKRGVASIFQSEQESVFASPEASDLLRWLRAVAAPGEVMLVRAALATRTLDLPFDQLSALAQDDDAYDLAAGQMRDLQKIWQTRGVLAMLRRTLHEFKCPARWLSSPDGERRLTNLLHLAELLQQASIEAQTDQELIQWLARRIDDSGEGPGEEQVLRLESDADLIQVITIHKSKGLEYPVVCLPFACSHRRIEERNKPAFVSVLDAGGERVLKLDCGPSDIEQADIERLREDLRLYYVALTRARHAVWMGFASLRHGNSKQCQTRHGAPGSLIAGSQALAESAWFDALKALSGFSERPNAGQEIATGALGPTQPCIVLEAAASHAASTMLNRTEPSPVLAAVRHYTAEFERWWAPGSYTSLTRDAGGSALAPTQARRPAEDEVQDLSDGQPPGPNPTPAANSDAAPWHRFPGGARGGDFVHGVLEWLTAEQFELAGKPRLEQALRDRCVRAGYPEHGEALVEWMHALLATELPGLGARLPQLRSRMCEMEFWMPAAALQSAEVDRLCRTHLLEGCERPALPHRTLNGMLMGFADLVFEHQGRYWVLDYKTNRPWADAIGRAAGGRAVYDRSSLAREMARHRYDVQAAVYLLALHRQLRARLGGAYDPRRQLGGAVYWFIRGIDGPVRGEYAIPADPGVIELLEQLDQQLGLEVEVLR
jgi:exodeoxyribonuclease V beta subunit